MNRPELFVKSVDTLVDAYENGNLRHLSACNCAVGNLIAYNTGTYNFHDKTGGQGQDWVVLMDVIRLRILNEVSKEEVEADSIFREEENGEKRFHLDIAFTQVYLTGYSPIEIAKIEGAFEKVNPETHIREADRETDSKEGLLRAIEVLGEIHEIPEETIHCMKEKVANKTYIKSFELVKPKDSRYEPVACSFPNGDPLNGVTINMDAVREALR